MYKVYLSKMDATSLVAKPASPETLTILTRFGLKLERERFKVSLGINLEEHDVEGLTGIARAIPLDFSRIRVYPWGYG